MHSIGNRKSLKTRSSVESVKEAIRKEFRNRLKQLRNENLYGVRNLTDDTANLQIVKASFRVDSFELTSAVVMEILEEVEREMQLEYTVNQCDQYEKDNDAVIEDMLRGINKCPVCDKLLNQVQLGVTNTICDQCTDSFN